MSSSFKLLLLLLLFSISEGQSNAAFRPIDLRARIEACLRGSKCRFFGCNPDPIILFSAPGVAVRRICLKNQDIGTIFSFGTVSVKEGSGKSATLTPFEKWHPSGMKPRFRTSPFQPATFPVSEFDNSGLTRKAVQGNQNKFMHGICVRAEIKQYELIQRSGAKKVIDASSPTKDCFEFVVNSPDLVFELLWFQTGDDLDLSITEPDGTVLDYAKKQSSCGRFIGGDAGIDGCERLVQAREKAGYFRACPSFQKGVYTLTVRHTSNCDEGATKFEVRVFEDGKEQTRATFKGVSIGDSREVIYTATYKVD